MYLAARSYWPPLKRRAPASRYFTGGTGAGGRAAASVAGAALSGGAPSVAAPHAPRVNRIVSVLSLPNATSFRRSRGRPPTSLATVALTYPRGGDVIPVLRTRPVPWGRTAA